MRTITRQFKRYGRKIVAVVPLLLCLAGIAAGQIPPQTPWDVQFPFPIPLGVSGSNNVISLYNNGQNVWCMTGTLGGVLQDLNGNRYILSAAHVLSTNLTGWFSGTQTVPIVQPGTIFIPNCGYQNLYQTYVVGNLTASLSVSFFARAYNDVDAAMAQTVPGAVESTSSILNMGSYSGIVAPVLKKGMAVQKMGAASGLTTGTITAIDEPVFTTYCEHFPTDRFGASCVYRTVVMRRQIAIEGRNFAIEGDSGSIVFTKDPCPQPIGLLISANGNHAHATPLSTVLTGLQTTSGTTGLALAQGGGGCTPPAAQVASYTTGDTDVNSANSVLPAFEAYYSSLMSEGIVDDVGIDLSGSEAMLIVYAANGIDPYSISNPPLTNYQFVAANAPASFEGIPVEVVTTPTADASTGISSTPVN